MAIIPFMSSVLKWRDTSILITNVVGVIIGCFMLAFSDKMEVLYLAYVFWILWATTSTLSRSSISKFLEDNEVGKAFTVLAIFTSVLPFLTKPFFSFLYKETMVDFPGAWILLVAILYIFVLLVLIYCHFGMKKQDRENKREEHKGMEM